MRKYMATLDQYRATSYTTQQSHHRYSETVHANTIKHKRMPVCPADTLRAHSRQTGKQASRQAGKQAHTMQPRQEKRKYMVATEASAGIHKQAEQAVGD